MTRVTAVRAMADAVSALVADHDVSDVLASLVRHCAALYPADAVAIMVMDRRGMLEPLSATSHRAGELELLQTQRDDGPCVEAVRTDRLVVSLGAADMEARWGSLGTAIALAGFGGVHAYPLHWQGRAIGGLNVFVAADDAPDGETLALGQLFADVSTLAVVRSDVRPDQVPARIHEAVTARAVVEQAKGVLAYQRGLDMAAAYDALVAESAGAGTSLSETARRIVATAHQAPPR